MKLSISLIAIALAVIAGSAVAAPALYPMERTSFERDVDIYSRGTQSQYEDKHAASRYTGQHGHHHGHQLDQEEDKHAASQYTEQHHTDHGKVAGWAHEAMTSCSKAMRLAVRKQDHKEATSQEMALTEVERLHHKHLKLSQTQPKTVEHQFINFDVGIIDRKKGEADEVIHRLGPWEEASYVSPY